VRVTSRSASRPRISTLRSARHGDTAFRPVPGELRPVPGE
jgi:hypothetical protein